MQDRFSHIRERSPLFQSFLLHIIHTGTKSTVTVLDLMIVAYCQNGALHSK